jgi:hypothetical protein
MPNASGLCLCPTTGFASPHASIPSWHTSALYSLQRLSFGPTTYLAWASAGKVTERLDARARPLAQMFYGSEAADPGWG